LDSKKSCNEADYTFQDITPIFRKRGSFSVILTKKGVPMPIYEFRCINCGHVFELLKLKKEDERLGMKCPKCNSEEVERVLSSVSVITSGGGKKTKQTMKSCSSGTCTSFEVPGHER
jgi:putative FmdB family regulatory protein